MSDTAEVSISSPTELLGVGRRHLAVKDFNAAVETLAKACEVLAKQHGDTADQCAEAYLWYGKALLGLSREESGVLGDGVPGAENADQEDDDSEEGENGENENDEKNGEAVEKENGEATEKEIAESEVGKEKESTTKDDPPNSGASGAGDNDDISKEEAENESAVNLENEDDVDNLQLAWEMLDLARSILYRRVQDGGGDTARALLADSHLALGEVALESETYDKAVLDMQSCLDLQKELYRGDDRRIAETHYQIGLANSLSSNFDDAVTHFKNAANILETKIKNLESPTAATEDATVYTIESEIKELKELLPEIREKIQDMMDYKTETIKRVRETLCPSNGDASSSTSVGFSTNGAGSSSATPKPAATNISHLIKRKRKASDSEDSSAAKKPNTFPIVGALVDYMDTSFEYLRRKTFAQAEKLHAKASRATLSATFMAAVCMMLGLVSNVKFEVVTFDQKPLTNDLHFMLLSKEDNLYIDDIDASRVMWCIEASDIMVILMSCLLIWTSSNVRAPLSEYMFLPWMGATLRGLFLRQGPTAGALLYTMGIVNGNVNPLFLTAFSFLFLLEGRLWLEVARLVRTRWEHREHGDGRDAGYEVETLWSNEDVQSVEVRNLVY